MCCNIHKHNFSRHQPMAQVSNESRLSPSDLPTRVLDVGDARNPRFRLTYGHEMRSDKYMAFSHCWGQGPSFSTSKSMVDKLRRGDGDTERRLPTSFRDAIEVTRGLQIQYLWIDSLCIIQDDEKDWENEAGRMEQVFSNAICVIAASSAVGSAEGFLSNCRPQRKYATLAPRPGVPRLYLTKFIDKFQSHVEQAVLNKRGWVLQERALARRSIHFTSTQMYMECGAGVYCESLTKLTKQVLSPSILRVYG